VTSQPSSKSSSRSRQQSDRDRSDQASANPKRPCRVTVTAPGWEGARTAAIAAGCSSVSDMLEKLGSGELSIITSDEIETAIASATSQQTYPPASKAIPQHIHIHTPTATPPPKEAVDSRRQLSERSLPKLIVTGICAAVIVGSLLYIADRIITITTDVITGKEDTEDIVTPKTGEMVAGYPVSDEYGIRPFHPVTGAPNVPHNGVDLATPVGTPIHAVGETGDVTTVKCWWDDGGGGWVVNQTAESYPDYVFQSLHMSKNGCREGKSEAGEVIAFSGNSGLGTGAHYDFRVKIDGKYVPPATKYVESAMTGDPPKE